MSESELYKIVQKHQDAFGPSAAEVARRIGAQPQTVSAWKTRRLTALPKKEFLVALAELTRTPYGDVLTAALIDCGYITKKESSVERPTTTEPEPDPAPAVERVVTSRRHLKGGGTGVVSEVAPGVEPERRRSARGRRAE